MNLFFHNRRIFNREKILAQKVGVHKETEVAEMGIEFIPPQFVRESNNPAIIFKEIVKKSDEFFAHENIGNVEQKGREIFFESNIKTGVPENNVVYGTFFSTRNKERAVIILPYWNANGASFDRIANLFALCGVSALRLSLPFHDARKPKNCPFAKYTISPNIGRTIQSVRQAVIDVRCAVDWLVSKGYKSIAIVGVSIGSCIATITAAHDERVKAIAQILMASNFAEVVWTGIATEHIRNSLEGFVDLTNLKHLWAGLSPDSYISKLSAKGTKVLILTGNHDPVFLPYLSKEVIELYIQNSVDYKWKTLSCGHYTLGKFPNNLIAFTTTLHWLRRVLL